MKAFQYSKAKSPEEAAKVAGLEENDGFKEHVFR